MLLWITGSKGLLGSALVATCSASFDEALHIPFLETGREVDITDRKQILGFLKRHPGITHIVNCAAFSFVDEAEERREEAFLINALGPENLAMIAQELGIKLVHISTDYVFAGKIRRLLTEKDPVGPCSYYGSTKLEGENRALALAACVIRTSWLFGSQGKNFVSKLFQMLQSQKEIRLTDDQWGRFTYAPDLSRAILKMLDQRGLYQFANLGVATKYEFARAMREEAFLMGYPIMAEALIPVPSVAFKERSQRPAYSAFDTKKIEAHDVAIRPWKEALQDFLCAQLPVYS